MGNKATLGTLIGAGIGFMVAGPSGAAQAMAIGGASGASIGATMDAAESAKKTQEAALEQQKTAQAEAKTAAEKQQSTSEQNINRARQKAPDVSGIQQAAEAGSSSMGTMLTGPQGVKPQDLSLGKTTLLGG